MSRNSRDWQTSVGGKSLATGDGGVEPGVGGREAVIRSAIEKTSRGAPRPADGHRETERPIKSDRRSSEPTSERERDRRTNQRKINLPENVLSIPLSLLIPALEPRGVAYGL